LPRVPPCDLLLISGDIAPDFGHVFSPGNGYRQLTWLNTEFKAWLDEVPAEEVVATAGNHDFALFRMRTNIDADLRWHLLIDQGVELFGLQIWGAPWVKDLPGWAFSLNEQQLEGRWERIPDNADILVLHGPPHEIGDWVSNRGVITHLGSTTLAYQILDRVKPRLVTFGHIHEAKVDKTIGTTRLVNASVLNDDYLLTFPAWTDLVDLEVKPAVTSDLLEV
jgi:Icc-related predicted phosphoesterase